MVCWIQFNVVMKTWRRSLVLLWLFVAATVSEAQLPELGPVVHSAIPLGAGKGQSVEVRIRGRNLKDTIELRFACQDIQAEVGVSNFYEVRARIEVGSNVQSGLYDYRLRTPQGSHIGVFHVGALPQQLEVEPNNNLDRSQDITTPLLIDGVIEEADYDLFRFRAQAGESVVADLMARRVASPLDATLAILDQRGNELEFNDDSYIFKDPHLIFTAQQTGEYFVRVSGTQETGSSDSSYRLVIGTVPLMHRVLPVGAQVGKTAEFELSGVNLSHVKKIVLSDFLTVGHVLQASPDRLRFRLAVPANLKPDRYFLHAFSESMESPSPLPILISKFTEQVSSSARRRDSPQPIELPVAISGVLDRRNSAEFFAFNVRPGQRVAFEVDSMKLGYLLDPALAIYDLNGQQIAYQDEPAPNSGKERPNLDPYLVHRFEQGGRYVVMIRDSAQRGTPNYVYRLLIQPAEPDFEFQVLTPSLTLFRGETNILPVRIRRLGGWDSPVEVWVENPPPGVRAEKKTAEPQNTPYKGTCGEDLWVDGTNVELPLKVSPDALEGFYPIRARAWGKMGDREVEHTAEVLYRWGSVGPIMGRTTEQQLVVTVTNLPPLILETPEKLTIAPGKAGRLKVIATRFGDAPKLPLTLIPRSLPPGVQMESNVLPPAAHQIELPLKSSESAVPGTYSLVLESGSVSSPPIELKISHEEEN